MRKIIFNQSGLRAGWRLLIFVGAFFALQFAADWMIVKLVHPRQRSFLDPVGTIFAESQTLVVVLIATWIMSRIEHCSFANYGIPLRNALGRRRAAGSKECADNQVVLYAIRNGIIHIDHLAA